MKSCSLLSSFYIIDNLNVPIRPYLPIIKKGYNVLDSIDSSRLGQAAKDRYRNFQVTVLVPYDTEMFNGFHELYLEAFLAEYDKEWYKIVNAIWGIIQQ